MLPAVLGCQGVRRWSSRSPAAEKPWQAWPAVPTHHTASRAPALTTIAQAVDPADCCGGQAEASAAQMDLVLELLETPDDVAGGLEYATDLFTRSTMDRMAGHLQVGSLHPAVCWSLARSSACLKERLVLPRAS